MTNISRNKIISKIETDKFLSFNAIAEYKASRIFSNIILVSFVVFIIVLFIPWTQNINTKGFLTTLKPNQRPQTLNSIIAGRIESWYVQEGDFVKKGDTIIFISEIKDEYFDPQLLERTEDQIQSKELAVGSYMSKVQALDNQIDALLRTERLKLEQAGNYLRQAELKIASDSIEFLASKTNLDIAERQILRTQELYDQGLKSLSELEEKKLKLQETQAKQISAENKLLSSRNQLINAKVEINSIKTQFNDKISKAESDKFASLSNMYDAEAVVTKMQNQYMNYSMRQGMYYITAPQDGYITQTIKFGIGETLKEGEELLTIMPSDYDLAVAIFVEPMDLPLINRGQKVMFMFDGWPSIAFSGWPNLSYGTFSGKVYAIDNFISENGKYRILVGPDPDDEPWPDGLRVGGGAQGMALLKDVPIGYELWRQLNGFPPDFYQTTVNSQTVKEKKK